MAWERGVPARAVMSEYIERAEARAADQQRRIAALRAEVDAVSAERSTRESEAVVVQAQAAELLRELNEQRETVARQGDMLDQFQLSAAARIDAVETKYATLKAINVGLESALSAVRLELDAALESGVRREEEG